MAHMSPKKMQREAAFWGRVKATRGCPEIPSKYFAHGPHVSKQREAVLWVGGKATEVAQKSHQKYVAHGPHVSKQREAAFWGGVKGARGCPEFPSKTSCSWATCLQTEGGCFLGWCKRRPRLPTELSSKYFAHGPHVSKQREAAFWGGGKGARGCPEFPLVAAGSENREGRSTEVQALPIHRARQKSRQAGTFGPVRGLHELAAPIMPPKREKKNKTNTNKKRNSNSKPLASTTSSHHRIRQPGFPRPRARSRRCSRALHARPGASTAPAKLKNGLGCSQIPC